jgi:exonuclease SbcC
MDDPVTHFDDLNAYAFAELIRSIIDNPSNQRQLIISTCDENMWDLFRQRFQNLNGRAIMYKFVTIGKNGPVIERVH